jgi:predicted nucleic acid-binding protein
MRQGEPVFVDSGAWIALALSRDPLHARAREQWEMLQSAAAKLHSSIPVIIETFTFLDRNAARDIALAWKDSVDRLSGLKIHVCDVRDLNASWGYFRSRCHQFCNYEAHRDTRCVYFRSSLHSCRL